MQIGVESSRAVENKRIFVVDSDEITRAVLQFMLHDENETHELGSMEQAYAKAEQWPPDLIMIGTTLMKEVGIGVIADLKTRLPKAKVLIVADTATDETASSGLKAGAHGILAKPLKIETVRRKADIMLGRRTALSIPVQVA